MVVIQSEPRSGCEGSGRGHAGVSTKRTGLNVGARSFTSLRSFWMTVGDATARQFAKTDADPRILWHTCCITSFHLRPAVFADQRRTCKAAIWLTTGSERRAHHVG